MTFNDEIVKPMNISEIDNTVLNITIISLSRY